MSSYFPVGEVFISGYVFVVFPWNAQPLAGTRTRGQACTVALGCLIFFDDYSSILIVGNSLRDVVRAVGVRRALVSRRFGYSTRGLVGAVAAVFEAPARGCQINCCPLTF